MVENWLFKLDLKELSRQEASFLLALETGEISEIQKAFISICEKRYENNNFFPDLGKIGIVTEKGKTPLERIFAIGF